MNEEAEKAAPATTPTTIWDRVRNRWLNHPLGIAIAVLAVGLPLVLTIWSMISDRIVPAIPPRLEVKALPGYEGGKAIEGCRASFQHEGHRVLTHGAHVSYALASSRPDQTEPIAVVGMTPKIRFFPGERDEFFYEVDISGLTNRGSIPNEFKVNLDGGQAGQAEWWIPRLKEDEKLTARTSNLFDIRGFPRPVLGMGRGDQGSLEIIKGTLLPTRAGLYEVRFVFESLKHGSVETDPVWIYYEPM